jgi:hypothetical protein
VRASAALLPPRDMELITFNVSTGPRIDKHRRAAARRVQRL